MGYRFDSLKQMNDFAKVHGGGRLPLDLLSDMKPLGTLFWSDKQAQGRHLPLSICSCTTEQWLVCCYR